MINPLKTSDMRLLGNVEVAELRQKIDSIPDWLWNAENKAKPNKFDALTTTQHIVFKFVDTLDSHCDYHERPLWGLWKASIQPLLAAATATFQYSAPHYPRVMLAKMPANTKIQRHIDAAKAAVFPHKIHIPLQTNPTTYFCHDHQQYHFEVGKAYEVNNNIYHWAENNGDTDRIHLIFECFNGEETL